MADINVTIKAVLLKYVGLDQLEECFGAVKFQLECVLRSEINEKIKKLTDEQLNQMGYFKKEDENVV
jgi:hypothetical protein